MDVKLVVVGGDTAQGSEFALQLPTVVGRSKTADVPLPNPLVSRKHCEIFEAGGQLMVRDLGSLNGTYIGKTRIESESAIPPGSLLTIGAITFRVEYVGANGAAAAAAPARAAAQVGNDDPTIDVDELESLEPLSGASGDDAEFSLSWLEEESSSPVQDSGEVNGAAAEAAAKKTVPAKAQPAAKASAPQGKAKSAADSDSLDDLCQ